LSSQILFNNRHTKEEAEGIVHKIYRTELPLQGLLTPTWQIPICLTVVSLPMLLPLLPGMKLEDDCALAIVTNIDSVSRLSPITESKTTSMPLLLLLLDVRGPTIICYICFVGNKQFKHFIPKFFRILVIVDNRTLQSEIRTRGWKNCYQSR